jgi:hypothetical protein
VSEVKDVMQAMDIATKAVKKAGLMFAWINNVKKEDTYWIVEVAGLVGRYIVKISVSTGEVVEFRSAT